MIPNSLVEKNLIINGRTINYKGIFSTDELFSVINQALDERGYIRKIKKQEALVTETGKRSYFELRPYKTKTFSLTLMIKIKITEDNIIEEKQAVQGVTKLFKNGNLTVVFDSWVLTDSEARWEMRPWYYFFKGVISKYIYNLKEEGRYKGELVEDTAYIHSKIKKLLNSYKGETAEKIPEENVRERMKEEIKRAEEDVWKEE